MRVLITRPEPDASRQAHAVASLGHAPVLAPMLAIETLPEADLSLDGAQALIVTSQNALRALAEHRELASAVGVPVFAVGEATARAAKALGFCDVREGPGTGEALAGQIAASLDSPAGVLVHLSGETVAFDLKGALEREGFTVRRSILYKSVAASELPPDVELDLTQDRIDAVILMSPRTATTFAMLLEKQDLVTHAARLVCYCLSGAVAKALEPLPVRVAVAASPREEELLALLAPAAS